MKPSMSLDILVCAHTVLWPKHSDVGTPASRVDAARVDVWNGDVVGEGSESDAACMGRGLRVADAGCCTTMTTTTGTVDAPCGIGKVGAACVTWEGAKE